MSLTGHVYSSGFKLQYIVEGNGTPTLVVGSSLYYSRMFSNNLRKSLKLAFVDHRGFSPLLSLIRKMPCQHRWNHHFHNTSSLSESC
jgi:hypothetical protein